MVVKRRNGRRLQNIGTENGVKILSSLKPLCQPHPVMKRNITKLGPRRIKRQQLLHSFLISGNRLGRCTRDLRSRDALKLPQTRKCALATTGDQRSPVHAINKNARKPPDYKKTEPDVT